MCSVTLLQKISTGEKSDYMPGQAIGPALSTQHLCSTFKSFFISKNHHTWGFQLLIPHKQNPDTQINQLAVTAKTISQPGIQLCVASVAVQSWQTDCQGLHERLVWLVQPSCLIWTQIILVTRQRLEKYSSYIMGQWTGHNASVWQQEALLSVCMQSQQYGCRILLREWQQGFWRLCYTGWYKLQMTGVMIWNTWHNRMILHWPLYFQDYFLILVDNWLRSQRRLIASGTTSTFTRSKVDLTAQCSTKCLRIRTIIVQFVTISDRLHGVYQQQ
jgi:hypothetical protein